MSASYRRFSPWVGAMVLIGATRVNAEIVFDNGDPSGGFGVAILSELDTINQVGDDFILGADAIVQSVEWWGTGDGNDFVIRIFGFEKGTPDVEPLLDLRVGVIKGTPEDFGGQTFLHYVAAIPDLHLDTDQYLLSIVDQTVDETWFWAASCEDGCEGLSWRRQLDGEPWEVGNFSMAFRIANGCAPSCPADLDCDGAVGTVDLLALLAAWGTDPGGPPDLDGNGDVGTSDLLALLSDWGPCP